MEKLYLSVIIPMFNVELYIEKCIDSLLSQSIKEMEIIIVDDGSTDLSYSKVLEYKHEHPEKIKLYRQENKGQSSARNFGLLKAKGKYVAFVDSDDFIDKDMYNKMILKAEKYSLDIVQCNYLNWYGDDSNKNYEYSFDVDVNKIYIGKEYFEYKPSLSPCDKVFKKSFLDEIGFHFEEGRYAEDVLEISKAFFYAKKIMYLNDVLYFYRRLNFNSTRNTPELDKKIKLGVDKIYIAYRLNNFCEENKWEGIIRRIINRNIIGSFFRKEIIQKSYRKSVINEFLKRGCTKILIKNFKIRDLIYYFKTGFKKLIFEK